MKKGLRGLFKNRKQKGQQQAQPETSSTSEAPTSTATAAAAAPVAAPGATEDVKPGGTSPNALYNSSLHSNKLKRFLEDTLSPPPATSAESAAPQSSEPEHHIAAPTKIEEAKAVDLNPVRDIKAVPSPGMSATSGPMGDHMAEVFQDTEPLGDGSDTRI